jgi:uncharacterized protein YllA (UPF0747 family)
MTSLFTGYFDKTYSQEDLYTGLTTTPGFFLENFQNCVTVIILQSYGAPPCLSISVPLTYQYYTWVTYSDITLSKRLGQITYDYVYFENEYVNDQIPKKMTILGKDGIYSDVKSVIMDFSASPMVKTIFE